MKIPESKQRHKAAIHRAGPSMRGNHLAPALPCHRHRSPPAPLHDADSDYVPLALQRESKTVAQTGPKRATCRNCELELAPDRLHAAHAAHARQASRQPDAYLDFGMKTIRRAPQGTPVFCGAGESAKGSGAAHFRARDARPGMCDHRCSFKRDDEFWTSYGHLCL